MCVCVPPQDKLFPQAIDYLQRAFSVRRRVGPVLLSRYVVCPLIMFLTLVEVPPHDGLHTGTRNEQIFSCMKVIVWFRPWTLF